MSKTRRSPPLQPVPQWLTAVRADVPCLYHQGAAFDDGGSRRKGSPGLRPDRRGPLGLASPHECGSAWNAPLEGGGFIFERRSGDPYFAKTDGAGATEENAALEVALHPPGRGDAGFGIAADGDEIVGRVGVTNAGDVLFDDRTLVEVGGHVVAGGADQLHPRW